MRRPILCAAALCLLLTACSGAADEASPTAAPSTPATSPATSPTASPQDSPPAAPNTAVERYCRGVDAFIAESEKALRQPARADTEKLQRMAAQLAEQAQALTSELIANPELTERVQQCTRRLNEFATAPAQG